MLYLYVQKLNDRLANLMVLDPFRVVVQSNNFDQSLLLGVHWENLQILSNIICSLVNLL